MKVGDKVRGKFPPQEEYQIVREGFPCLGTETWVVEVVTGTRAGHRQSLYKHDVEPLTSAPQAGTPQPAAKSSPLTNSVLCGCGFTYHIPAGYQVVCSCGANHRREKDGSVTSSAQPNWQTIYDSDTVDAVTKPKPKVDEREAELQAKVLPKFRHEEACQPPPIKGYPTLPYFADAPERNEQSRKEMKRWISTNLKDWPVCRFERTPLNLVIEGRPLKNDPYGGEKATPQFHCPSCGRYGEVT